MSKVRERQRAEMGGQRSVPQAGTRCSNSHFDRINAFVVHALACFGASGTLKRGQQTLAKLQNENCRRPLPPATDVPTPSALSTLLRPRTSALRLAYFAASAVLVPASFL